MSMWRRYGRCDRCGVGPQERCASLKGTGTLRIATPHPGRVLLSSEQIRALEEKRAS